MIEGDRLSIEKLLWIAKGNVDPAANWHGVAPCAQKNPRRPCRRGFLTFGRAEGLLQPLTRRSPRIPVLPAMGRHLQEVCDG